MYWEKSKEEWKNRKREAERVQSVFGENEKLSEGVREMKKKTREQRPEEPSSQPRRKVYFNSANNGSILLSSHTLSHPRFIWPQLLNLHHLCTRPLLASFGVVTFSVQQRWCVNTTFRCCREGHGHFSPPARSAEDRASNFRPKATNKGISVVNNSSAATDLVSLPPQLCQRCRSVK